VVLFDNSGFEYLAQFDELSYRKAKFSILEKRKNKFSPKKEIFLFQALIKSDRFEWILEKGTELGIKSFRPIVSSRFVGKKFNLPRALKIIKESSEQSGRAVLPTITEPVSLSEALRAAPPSVAAFDAHGAPFCDSKLKNCYSMSLFIGPEGGWSEQELSLFREQNIALFSLGTQTLRSETAAIAAAALLLL
jgi:16S rRNA (uracil1498-N3)-methyltransferase